MRACARACACAAPLLLPGWMKPPRARACKFSPALSLIMKSLIVIEFQKITWIYMKSFWLELCAKGEPEAVYQEEGRYSKGCSPLYSDHSLPLFPPVFNEVETREGPFHVLGIRRYFFSINHSVPAKKKKIFNFPKLISEIPVFSCGGKSANSSVMPDLQHLAAFAVMWLFWYSVLRILYGLLDDCDYKSFYYRLRWEQA